MGIVAVKGLVSIPVEYVSKGQVTKLPTTYIHHHYPRSEDIGDSQIISKRLLDTVLESIMRCDL